MQFDENPRWVINQAEALLKLLELGEAEIAKGNFCTAEDFFAEMDQLDDANNGTIDQ